MKKTRTLRPQTRLLLWLAAMLVALPALQIAVAQDAARGAARDGGKHDDRYSKGQMLLFGAQHLENVTSPGVLRYDFRQSGPAAREIEDEVALTISRINEDGGKDLSTVFLSGDHRKEFGDIPGFRSNPLIMYFLQWDVEKMDAASGVSHHYYRSLLRGAMRSDMHSEEVTVNHGGRKLKGDKVYFEPLTSKKGDKKYAGHFSKRYEFILTEEIPGYIYSISTLVPGDKPGAEPLEHTRITFNRLEPAKAE